MRNIILLSSNKKKTTKAMISHISMVASSKSIQVWLKFKGCYKHLHKIHKINNKVIKLIKINRKKCFKNNGRTVYQTLKNNVCEENP